MSSTSAKPRQAVLAIASMAMLCGCASTPNQDDSAAWLPIDLALTSPMEQLRADAQLGQASAQYALWIIDRYGLRGARPDLKAADVWLARAWSARRVTIATPLTSGAGRRVGLPARAAPEVDLQSDLSPEQDSLTRQCLGLLANPASPARLKSTLAGGACGGPGNFGRLKVAWRAAL